MYFGFVNRSEQQLQELLVLYNWKKSAATNGEAEE